MKIIVGILILFLLAPLSYSQDLEYLLNKLETNIINTEYLQYTASFKRINPTIEDSIYTYYGTVSLQIVPSDTIFGAYFNASGIDRKGEYDYFYDGLYGYEISHTDNNIITFNPYQFPNTPNNPAKARITLSIFIPLLIDNNIVTTLTDNITSSDVRLNKKENIYRVTFVYNEDEYGQRLERTLLIDNDTYSIKRINQKLLWMGTLYTTNINLSDYKRNDESIASYINLSESYDDYSKEMYSPPEQRASSIYDDLLGNKAPDFLYPSFTGDNVSIRDLTDTIILLDFWETWCGYCILAMPRLNELYNKYSDDNFMIIGITTENKEQVERLINVNKLKYQNVFADTAILSDYKVVGRPVYVLINKDGYIEYITSGNLQVIINRLEEIYGY